MLHGRPGDPDPVIAGWLAGHAASRGQMTCPGQVPIVWNRASPALQASLAGPLAAQADTVRQLRYRAVAGPARIPDPARGRERAAAVPSLMWPGWALRLLPAWGRDFQRSRALLAVMLAIAVTGEEYGTAAGLLGLEPSRLGKLGNFTALLRSTAPWNRSRPRSASSPATSTSTAPLSPTTPAADGKAASARRRWIPEAGAASANSRRHSATAPAGTPRRRSSSPGSA
jgi:hypothetical protein